MEHLQCFKLCCGEESHRVLSPLKVLKQTAPRLFFFFPYQRESGITACPILQGHCEISEVGCQKKIHFLPGQRAHHLGARYQEQGL